VQPLATSKALFIHRNTLEYRLNRISELTGLDLGSFDDRLLLYIALQLDEQRRDKMPGSEYPARCRRADYTAARSGDAPPGTLTYGSVFPDRLRFR
jgi:hypothetical protein